MQTAEVTIGKDDLAARLAEMRAWLDEKRFEPPSFRTIQRPETLLLRVSFKVDDEARAFAARFGGSLMPRARARQPSATAPPDDDRSVVGGSRSCALSPFAPVLGGSASKGEKAT